MHTDPDQLPEEEQSVPPGDDSNDDPTPPLPADPGPAPERNPAVDTAVVAANDPALKDPPKKEEPEIGNERDIPSDGRDLEGEAMIDNVNQPSAPTRQSEKE